MAELLPLLWMMRPNLQLVKPARTSQRDRETREIRFRYPAEEEIWEVSCEGIEEKSRRTPALRNTTRRAS